jgi:peptide/nickel transport system substrate-binding protein
LIYTLSDYDPLIYLNYQGGYEPDLATSWGYVGHGNKTFDITLRQGVKFQDGTPLTANAVKASLEYLHGAGGQQASQLSNLGSIKVLSKYKLQINFSSPDPVAPYLFSQVTEIGFPIGPRGIADPASLSTQSDGTGPFELTQAGVVPNVSYTFIKNPHYWNPSAVHWSQFVIKVIGPSPSTIYSAISTNQVMFSTGSPATAAAATGAGLKISKSPFVVWSLYLLDRNGTVAAPLANLQVRQAINYALDRPAINAAINGTSVGVFGSPTDEPAIKGTIGYDAADANAYPYDPTKAKQLLAAAGYPNGFKLTDVDTGLLDVNGAAATAVASELAAVGITLTTTLNSASINQFAALGASKNFPTLFWGIGYINSYLTFTQANAPGTDLNPFDSTDATANRYLLQGDANNNAAGQAALWTKVTDTYVKDAWYAPLYLEDNLFYSVSSLKNVQADVHNSVPDPFAPTAAGGWYLGS